MTFSGKAELVIGTLIHEWPIEVPDPIEQLLRAAPHSFDDARLAQIAVSLREVHKAGEDVNCVSVSRHLEGRSRLAEVGGDVFVRGLIHAAAPIGVAVIDATTLWEGYQVRQRKQVLHDAVSAMEADPARSREITDNVVAVLAQLNSKARESRLTVRRPSEILAMQFDDSDVIMGDRVLAMRQFATILGPGGLGKSRYAMQLGAACIARRDFPGFVVRPAKTLRWLFIQAENSNRRLQSDLSALRNWAGKDWPLIDANLFIHTIETDDDGFLCLSNPQTQLAIESMIGDTRPDVVVYDPLKDFGVGDLNGDEGMMETCRIVARLTRKGNPDRAGIVLHHSLTGKTGAARAVGYDRASYGRNSKVLQAWTRAQINIAPGKSDSNEVLVVSCGKLSNGREFSPHAVRLNQQTMIYELDTTFDLAAWEAETTGRTATVELTSDRVASVCAGAMTKKDLVAAIMADSGVGKTKAYAAVEKAEKTKRIHLNPVSKTYVSKR